MRTIRISISANGKGLQSHAMKLTLEPMDSERAVVVFKKLCEAVMQIVSPK
jgi:hypothetical protein